ncbi:MAG: DNA gyrase subunit B, partial [Vicinamibacteria bacterium]|nr:DNA gyrase subunit B [Vicinamibacteria bacterium]
HRDMVILLLRHRVKDVEVFADKGRLLEIIRPLRDAGEDVILERDEEHGIFEIVWPYELEGQPRECRVGDEFITSAEYRALSVCYEEFRALDDVALTIENGEQSLAATRATLVTHLMGEGRRGLTISRYKGLGEMNADELWETTMDPATRTLLQVRLDDEEVAENIFTTLMGDAVEPRRQFIEENALNVRNLDI